jgi:histone-lysine N-methyltransferase SETD3
MTDHAECGSIKKCLTSATAGSADADELKMQRFLRWMEEQGATFPAMTIKVGQGSRQVHATRSLLPGELVLHIPRKLMITTEVAKASAIGKLIATHGGDFTDHDYLVAYLLQIKREGGFWKPYIDILPTDYSHIAAHFSESEMACLEGSYITGVVRTRRKQEDDSYNALAACLKESWFTREDFAWGYSIVKSRVYSVVLGGKESRAMVPLADMFDHNPDKSLRWIKASDTGFIVTARESVEQGAALFESYGVRCNARLLNVYGFCVDFNPENHAEIFLRPVSPDHPLFEHTKNLGTESGAMRAFRMPGIYHRELTYELFSRLRLGCLIGPPGSQHPAVEVGKCPRVKAISRANEIAALTELVAACERAMRLFRTTIGEDEALLKDESLSRNLRNAVTVRHGEKVVLKYFLDLAATALPVLGNPSSILSEYAAEGKRFALYFADVDEGLRERAKADETGAASVGNVLA